MSTQEPLPRAYEPAQVEAKWFPKWEAAGNFHGKPNPEKKPYSIVIPPPNVTGILTLGHVLNNTLQDILCRYHRMKGEEVCWFPGTDHAGIATEARVEKYLRKEENTTSSAARSSSAASGSGRGSSAARSSASSARWVAPATGSGNASRWMKDFPKRSARFLSNSITKATSTAVSG